MKRVIKSWLTNQPAIEILINIDYDIESIAASTIEHPTNFKKQRRLSEIKLGLLNDIVDSVISCVLYHDFDILEKYQSKRSYSYYLTFQPQDAEGNKLTPIPVKFRMGDHDQKSNDSVKPQYVVIVSIIMGAKVFDNRFEFLQDFNTMCEGLKSGSLKSVDIMDKYM